MIAEHTQTTTEAPIVLQCVDLCKCYNGVVQASDHINFTLRRGEVHAFLGENGAGKSTLMKMLYGIEQPDEGQMFLSGEPVVLKSPADAIAHGIGMVHQASDGGGKHYPGAGGQDQMRTAEKAGSVTQYPGAGRLLWLRHRP